MAADTGSSLRGIRDVDDISELKRVLASAAEAFGFEAYAYHMMHEGSCTIFSDFIGHDARKNIVLDIDALDAVLSAAVEVNGPVEWTQRNSCSEAARLGRDSYMPTGVSTPVNISRSDRGALSFVAASPISFDVIAEAKTMMPVVAHAFHAKIRSLPETGSVAPLSKRERECIAWAARGKTMVETSLILGISERTVLFHMTRLKQRLNADTVAHAVFKAFCAAPRFGHNNVSGLSDNCSMPNHVGTHS